MDQNEDPDRIPAAPAEDDAWRTTILRWSHGFEFIVILALFVVIAVVVILAMVRLTLGIVDIAAPSRLTELNAVQRVFGMIMTVLIALEFGNSILRHLRENETIIQAREIILISLMAIVRKIMLVDLATQTPLTLVWLALATLALAVSYWLMGRNGHA